MARSGQLRRRRVRPGQALGLVIALAAACSGTRGAGGAGGAGGARGAASRDGGAHARGPAGSVAAIEVESQGLEQTHSTRVTGDGRVETATTGQAAVTVVMRHRERLPAAVARRELRRLEDALDRVRMATPDRVDPGTTFQSVRVETRDGRTLVTATEEDAQALTEATRRLWEAVGRITRGADLDDQIPELQGHGSVSLQVSEPAEYEEAPPVEIAWVKIATTGHWACRRLVDRGRRGSFGYYGYEVIQGDVAPAAARRAHAAVTAMPGGDSAPMPEWRSVVASHGFDPADYRHWGTGEAVATARTALERAIGSALDACGLPAP